MTNAKNQRKPAPQDWHKADIKAALEKAGYTLRSLSALHGMSYSYFTTPLAQPAVRAQTILANTIGVPPQQIWPSRYEADGSPKRGLYTNAAKGLPVNRPPNRLKPFTSLDRGASESNAKVQAEV